MFIERKFYAPEPDDYPLTFARVYHSGLAFPFDGNSVTAVDEVGYFETGPNNPLTYEKWKVRSTQTTNARWRGDWSTEKTVGSICIAAHTLGSSQTPFRLQTWDGASTYSNITDAGIIVDDDSPIIIDITPAVDCFGIRLVLETPNPDWPTIGYVTAGGPLMQLPVSIYGGHTPAPMGRNARIRSNLSSTGEFLGRSLDIQSLNTTFSWSDLPKDFATTTWRDFQLGAESEPFFIAWNPETFPNETVFGQAVEIPKPVTQGVVDKFAVDLTIRGRVFKSENEI